MNDPERLLGHSSDADELERELLTSIRRIDPPAHAKTEAWARLSAQIAAVALVSSSPHAAAAATNGATANAATGFGAKVGAAPALFKLLGAKAAIALAASGVIAYGSVLWLHGRAEHVAVDTQVTRPAPAALHEETKPTSAPTPALDAPAPSADAAAQSMPDAPNKPSPEQHRRDQLGAESALLTRARASLRRGDAAGAQQILNRMQAEFPKGVLGQEREVLAIEVLAARGNAAAAKKRAQAFIAAYPESPHSSQLSRYTE